MTGVTHTLVERIRPLLSVTLYPLHRVQYDGGDTRRSPL